MVCLIFLIISLTILIIKFFSKLNQYSKKITIYSKSSCLSCCSYERRWHFLHGAMNSVLSLSFLFASFLSSFKINCVFFYHSLSLKNYSILINSDLVRKNLLIRLNSCPLLRFYHPIYLNLSLTILYFESIKHFKDGIHSYMLHSWADLLNTYCIIPIQFLLYSNYSFWEVKDLLFILHSYVYLYSWIPMGFNCVIISHW